MLLDFKKDMRNYAAPATNKEYFSFPNNVTRKGSKKDKSNIICLKCGKPCRVRPQATFPSSGLDPGTGHHRDLLMSTSGVICKDFSVYGSLEGTGGKSMPSQERWTHERNISAERKSDMAECVTGWEPSGAAAALEDKSHPVQVVLGPL